VVDENFFLSSFSFLPPITQASEHTNEQKEEKKNGAFSLADFKRV
jgi:hypothetical protein